MTPYYICYTVIVIDSRTSSKSRGGEVMLVPFTLTNLSRIIPEHIKYVPVTTTTKLDKLVHTNFHPRIA